MSRRMVLERTAFREMAPQDREAVRKVATLAHAGETEARLFEALVASFVATLSFVAETDDQVVAHILLTEIEGPPGSLALAPLSVDPAWRDFLIGTELVRVALHAARERGWRAVFVEGDPGFYGRFGFSSTLADRADVPFQGERFLAVELVPGALDGWSGPLSYPPAFGTLRAAPDGA